MSPKISDSCDIKGIIFEFILKNTLKKHVTLRLLCLCSLFLSSFRS